MDDIKKILAEYVSTANNPKYKGDYNIINSKFPELKNYDTRVLAEYVSTANNPKYNNDYNIINSKFPEFFTEKKNLIQNGYGSGLQRFQNLNPEVSTVLNQTDQEDIIRSKNIKDKFSTDYKVPKIELGLPKAKVPETELNIPQEIQVQRKFAAPTAEQEFGLQTPEIKSNIGDSLKKQGGFQTDIVDSMKKFGEANVAQDKKMDDLDIVNSISQYLYLPSLNQGFNDLVTKPLAGATDIISRTINESYKAVTGKEAPEWMQKGGGFDNIVKFYDNEYNTRVKPTSLVSDVAEGFMGTTPLIAAMAIGGANPLTAAPKVFTNLTRLFAVKGGLNSFKDATDEKLGYVESLNKLAGGTIGGVKEGLELEAMMLFGGALGKGAVNILAEKGLFKGGEITKAALHALAVGTTFGGTSAGSDLLNGRDVNTREALKQFGMGLAFEIIPTAKGIDAELKDRKSANQFNSLAVKQAALAKSASNLNSESALRNLINLTPEQIQSINTGVKKTRDELYAESIESGAKAYDENNPVKKRELYIDQLVLKSQGDIKLLSEKISENSGEIKDLISKSEELTPLEKLELLDKIDLLNLKPKENAVQVETAGKVPVQSKAEVSGEVVEGKPKSEVEIAAEESAKAEEVARLRAAEQVELNDAIPNADQYLTNGKVDKEKLTDPKDIEVFQEIYDRYNKPISLLLTEKIIAENIEIPKLNEDNLSNAIEDLTDIADTRRKDKRDIKMKKLEESMDMSSPEVKIAKGINDNFVEIKKQLKDKGILETKCK